MSRTAAFFAMSIVVGVFANISLPAGATAAVVVFGYGVSEICDAIRERR